MTVSRPSLQLPARSPELEETMSLPFVCTAPGESSTPAVEKGILDKVNNILWASCKLETVPSKVVTVGTNAGERCADRSQGGQEAPRGKQNDGIQIAVYTGNYVSLRSTMQSTAWENDTEIPSPDTDSPAPIAGSNDESCLAESPCDILFKKASCSNPT